MARLSVTIPPQLFGPFFWSTDVGRTSVLRRKYQRMFCVGYSIDGIQVCYSHERCRLQTYIVLVKLRDRHEVMFKAQHISATGILRLICTCLGLHPPLSRPQLIMNLGLLSQTRLRVSRDSELMNYLLLSEKTSSICQETVSLFTESESAVVKLSPSKFLLLASEVLEFLIENGSALREAYFFPVAESVSGINADIIQICMTLNMTGYALLSIPRFQDLSRKVQLESVLHEIGKALKHSMLHHDEHQDLVRGAVESFSTVLPAVKQLIARKDPLTDGVIAMAQLFDQTFWNSVLDSGDTPNTGNDRIGLELEDDFDSQVSKGREESSATYNAHSEIPASTNAIAFRACVAAKMCLMSTIKNNEELEDSLAHAASLFVEYLTNLRGQHFLACRVVILEVLDSEMPMPEDDAATLLQFLAEVLLRSYEFERSEVSMGMILNVMTSLAEMWTTDQTSDTSSMGEVLYSWFVETALKKGILSPYVHMCMSAMLQKIIKVCPDYGKKNTLTSTRTTLFEVLRDGNLVVKFHIGSRIANIFGLFVLKEHEAILEDVIDSLPNDPNWIEGIALRLFVLSHLAACWSTLLRRCIYAILECPRYVPTSTEYAKSCVKHITMFLKLAKSEDLFKLFVPQILYTWLESEPMRLFPYIIFGYETLSDLLGDVQDETVGQIIMRGKDNEAEQLSADLDTPFERLLQTSFSKASAYCIARDVAMPSSSNTQAPHAEARVRKNLGKERYASLVVENFANIIAIFFKTIDPDGQVEKAFEKHPGYVRTHTAYESILSNSGPGKALPMNQQPSFKARYLLDEIEFLCRRTSYDAESLWTPELYCFVFREILNSIHPALGSLHACSVLRRIRILISMVGSIALEQYPLEMSLQSLKPYLTDAQCAEEAIGIVQYLLEHGASYLQETPSFLAGHAVSMLTSMKAFFDSTQDSTTQESQFQATMSRAQAFHAWFSAYLGRYKSSRLSEESAKCFRNIINAASHIQTGGNANINTHESDLLLEVLEDQRSGRDLLDQSCRDTIFKFLCTAFTRPSDFRDDVLGSDQMASAYASIIWKSCHPHVSSPNYRLWAGRVLGRAYAGKGLVDRDLVSETFFESTILSKMTETTMSPTSSRINILKLLCNILHDETGKKVGMAESTLRSIVTKTDGTEDSLECDQCIPVSLKESLLWNKFHLPVTGTVLRNDARRQDKSRSTKSIGAEDWIQKLCIALVLTKSDDPILSELAFVLESTEGLAEKAFPYILHLVLLEEINGHQITKRKISERCQQMFRECSSPEDKTISSVRILLQAILYMRTQPLPNETSKDDRALWLDIDYKQAAAAAISCHMFKTALLFLELDYSRAAKLSKRSSVVRIEEPGDLLLEIYKKIDEQDAFYGVQQPSSLSSMMARLEYEHAGFKSLSFRGAHYDGQLRLSSGKLQEDEESIVRALDNLDLNGLSQSLLSKMTSSGPTAMDSVLRTARKLEQWDISAPASHSSSASTIFRAFQGINSASNSAAIAASLDQGFSEAMDQLMVGRGAKSSMHEILGSLAILTEADELFSSRKSDQIFEVLGRFKSRDYWMHSERFVVYPSSERMYA